MPYKTPFGNHYHTKLGCNGAFIPCGTSGLEPCSVCCESAYAKTKDQGDMVVPAIGRGSAGQASDAIGNTSPSGGTSTTSTTSLARQGQSSGSPIVAFAASHSQAELAGDADGAIRQELVDSIDAYVESLPEQADRERTRMELQREWNEAHPDSRILEWSKDDRDYETDSRNCLTRVGEPENVISDEYEYSFLDKATGRDLTDEIHHLDFVLRQIESEIQDYDREVRDRNISEYSQTVREPAYERWLEEKRRTSKKQKYYPSSIAEGLKLYAQFDRETRGQYVFQGDTIPNESEQEVLDSMQARADEARGNLHRLLDRYGIDPAELVLLKFQYVQTNCFGVFEREVDPLAED